MNTNLIRPFCVIEGITAVNWELSGKGNENEKGLRTKRDKTVDAVHATLSRTIMKLQKPSLCPSSVLGLRYLGWLSMIFSITSQHN